MRLTPAATLGMLWLGANQALAIDSSEYLFVPTVTQGEREIDLHMGTASSGALTGAENNAGVGFGMGATAHWFTEMAVQYREKQDVASGFDALEWENVFQIGEPGEWPVDLGMVFNVERPFERYRTSLKKDAPSARFGPLLQKNFGKFQANLNLILEHYFHSMGVPSFQVRYQSQVKYRYSPPLEFGIQAFGKLGTGTQTFSGYPEEEHKVGPVLLGHFAIPGERSLSYNVALLFGTTQRSPDRTLRLQLEYEF
jgi:hypothetical protein